ncbi:MULTISPECIES: hypothetical protein [Streptomyces]|uniref:Uncharacterized protein n=2 Tax=Streptomyces TaxID=1883 RepID=A0A124ED13_9ACTN|nr:MULTISPECIES: hypothetical protein [Streptomyces]KUH39363.1 hypothetical protein ATE80_08025 [Streptomyces kanasensis]UUS33422.1 hypothetical protein NRO40_23165 [Streptomyces changanensis]
MSQEAVPEQAPFDRAVSAPGTPVEQGAGAPDGLLRQTEETEEPMAALTADLSQLDADLQSSADRADGDDGHRAS